MSVSATAGGFSCELKTMLAQIAAGDTKLDARNRTQAVAVARRMGVLA